MKSSLPALIRRLLLPAICAGALAGCDRLFTQKGPEALDMAHEKEKEGDYQAAIQWYEASLDGTPATAEAHYSMALDFDDKLGNPIAALDHFRRYLQLLPDGPHAADAKSFADQDQFKLTNILSHGNFMPQQDAVRLENQNLDLQKQLSDARQQISDLRSMLREGGAMHGADPIERPIPAGARTYTVEPGDTLRSISRMYFHTPTRWQDIQDANFQALGGAVKLKVGMTLVIPRS